MSSRSEKGEGTRLHQFLEMAAVSGELTADMAKRLPVESAYLRKCTGLAKKRRLVTVYYKDEKTIFSAGFTLYSLIVLCATNSSNRAINWKLLF